MRYLTLGILAHVDAGKTTLSEALLYESGMIRKAGRVDHKDAFLDTHELEKGRGITIFSKQALIDYDGIRITLLDTPGHVDFSAETERTLMVLDAAVLVISGTDGVQSHSAVLFNLLKKYQIPIFIFFNKMDMPGADKEALIKDIRERLSGNFTDFTSDLKSPEIQEELAICDEKLLEAFLEKGEEIDDEKIAYLIGSRSLYPCYFGSALKINGVKELLEGLKRYLPEKEYPQTPAARVYKISTDEKNCRLTFMKVTGGTYSVKDTIEEYGEKIEQIRLYSGRGYETVKKAEAGMTVAVTGISSSKTGDRLGNEKKAFAPALEPVLRYTVISQKHTDPVVLLGYLKKLEEEDPTLHVSWEEETRQILVRLMGQVQLEIIRELMKDRFDEPVEFEQGSIIYKETILDRVEGAGHFEPLRHYAEVHLILEPLSEGSGVVIDNICSTDTLSKNWQNLILTHLTERAFKGTLTGSEITDIKITLASGKAHIKHTEGGDFRQATYRAVRNGLLKAKGALLEPWYDFRLFVPEGSVGRAMTDLDKAGAVFSLSGNAEGMMSVITGKIPAKEGINYADEVRKYTAGEGRIELDFCGYKRCHDEETVIEEIGYDPERDIRNTGDSVFCSHGAGVTVPWYEADSHMHLPPVLSVPKDKEEEIAKAGGKAGLKALSIEEIDAIIERTYYSNRRKNSPKKAGMREMQYRKSLEDEADTKKNESSPRNDRYKEKGKNRSELPAYTLVDGYNVIFSWEDLKSLASLNIDSARDALLDILCNYRGLKPREVIVVFDAYRVSGHDTEFFDHNNIHVVFTKEAQTADSYIEHFAHEHAGHYDVTVVTSDGTEQVIVLGAGCRVMTSKDFQKEVIEVSKAAADEFTGCHTGSINSMEGRFDEIILDKKKD